MELKTIQIFKYLPASKKDENTNCKKCGCPTCMAFAIKLGQKKIDIEKCPFAPQELKDIFQEAIKIQQKTINLKYDDIKIGGETVMFRHDKTFVNKPLICIKIDCDKDDYKEKIEEIKKYSVERVGEIYKISGVELIGNKNYQSALKLLDDAKINIINEQCEIYKALNVDELQNNPNKENTLLELDIKNKNVNEIVNDLTLIHRFAILDRNEKYSSPVLVHIDAKDVYKANILASLGICRYANVIVLDTFDKSMLSAIFTLRQNIFTDPQKPLQVESKVYEINNPDENAYIVMTTNFALTYFAVANELEATGLPIYLVITPSDGLSVLTAWSADKFNAQIVGKMVRNSEKLNKVKNKTIIIPGLLAHMKEELEEELKDWKIMVGTVEAWQIPAFFKQIEK